MKKLQIAFLDRATFIPAVRFRADRIPGAVWREYATTAPGEIVDRIGPDTAVVAVNKVRLTGETMARRPALRMVALTATGTDNVDLDHARAHGIAVANVRDYATASVPEHVFALLLALRRRLHDYQAAARDGRWTASPFFCVHAGPIEDLAGATFGIVGGGVLGQATARLARAFGMRVLAAERRGAATVRAGRVPFERMLAESDALSLHLPLTPQTRHLFGEREFALMKPGAILINTARGALIEPRALVAALQSGRLGGAGIDVLDIEPPPAGHPLLAADLPNLIVTPHVAWASLQAQQKLADEVIENIAAFARGEERNRVV